MINIETLKNFSQVRKYNSGTIFSKDSFGTEMYVVLQGEVAIVNSQDNKVITIVGPGEFFDESLLFSGKRSSNTSVAVTDVIALPISKNNVVSFLADEPKFVFELMRALYERIENISSDYEDATGHKWVPNKTTINSNSQIKPSAEKEHEETKNEPQTIASNNESQIIASHNEFELLPEGHTGNYELPLTNDNELLREREYKCPICNSKFKGFLILSSQLGAATTDKDMHKHYKNIEPVYYEVITCPNCLYSALASMFEKAEDEEKELSEELRALKNTVDFKFGTKPDTAAVFAGYYLALLCAPKCFPKFQLIQAKLLHRLSWMYHDCKDEQMEINLTKQALEKYLKVYTELTLSPDQEQQICMIIGELNLKLGNISEAKNFYYNAKMNKQAASVMIKRAENRLEEIKEIEQGKKTK